MNVSVEHRPVVCVPSGVALGCHAGSEEHLRWAHRENAYVPVERETK